MILTWIIISAVVIGWAALALLSFPFIVNDSCKRCTASMGCDGVDSSCPEPYFRAAFAPITFLCMFFWRCVFRPSTRFISRWQTKRIEKYGIKMEEKKKTREERLTGQIVKLTVDNKVLRKRVKKLNKYSREEILDLE